MVHLFVFCGFGGELATRFANDCFLALLDVVEETAATLAAFCCVDFPLLGLLCFNTAHQS